MLHFSHNMSRLHPSTVVPKKIDRLAPSGQEHHRHASNHERDTCAETRNHAPEETANECSDRGGYEQSKRDGCTGKEEKAQPLATTRW
jgi:hypothetical protein